MRYFVFLILLPMTVFSETINVALYENHDNYIKYSRSYKVNWELLKLAAKNEGVTLKAKPYLWLRSLDALKKNKVDAVIGAYYSKERSEIGYFSSPFALDEIYLYSKNRHSISLNEVLAGNALVGVTTNAIGDSLAKKLQFSDIYRKSSSEQVFELLDREKLDYAIFSESVASTHCSIKYESKGSTHCLFPITSLTKAHGLHTIFSQTLRNKNIAERQDSATNKLISRGKAKAIFLSAGYNEQEYDDWLKARINWAERPM